MERRCICVFNLISIYLFWFSEEGADQVYDGQYTLYRIYDIGIHYLGNVNKILIYADLMSGDT